MVLDSAAATTPLLDLIRLILRTSLIPVSILTETAEVGWVTRVRVRVPLALAMAQAVDLAAAATLALVTAQAVDSAAATPPLDPTRPTWRTSSIRVSTRTEMAEVVWATLLLAPLALDTARALGPLGHLAIPGSWDVMLLLVLVLALRLVAWDIPPALNPGSISMVVIATITRGTHVVPKKPFLELLISRLALTPPILPIVSTPMLPAAFTPLARPLARPPALGLVRRVLVQA